MPSLADLYGTSAPVARVIPLPDGPDGPRPALPSRPAETATEVDLASANATALGRQPGEDESPGTGRKPFWVHLLPTAFLLLCLLVTVGRDLTKGAQASPAPPGEPAALTEVTDPRPRIGLRFHDREMTITLGSGGVKPEGQDNGNLTRAAWEPSMRFGLVMLDTPDPTKPGKLKRLTFEEEGLTNNVCVKLDGSEWLFGERPFRRLQGGPVGDWPGRWLQQDVRLPNTPGSIDGRRSTWVYDEQQVEITQTAEAVRGSQSGLLDTCLVRYKMENKDRQRHRVGIRFLLDTFIGSNDGVPFLIPGHRQLCSTKLDFPTPTQGIPDFIQACENEDLARPGTIAQVGLRLGGGLEPPSRVTLGAWPNPELQRLDRRCEQEKTLWDVPVLSIHSLREPDSAVTIYWEEKDLFPGQSREVGFTYGLGSVSAGEGAGKLALTVGGSFAPRGEFTVTAYVSNPVAGQKVTLQLPDDFDLTEGTATQAVPPLPADGSSRNSPVTWKVRGPRQEGRYNLKVQSSTGVSQTQPVKIQVKGIFGD